MILNRSKIILTLVGVHIFIHTLFSQSGGINSPMSELIPATPDAAAMTQYGKIAIGEFTGTMQHSINVYEINYKDLKVPITLNYSSNGVNIDKLETIVGIDWSLNWGGVISRTIMDDPDEACPITFPDPPYNNGNPLLGQILNSDCADIQPDIFNFNIAGFQGRFYVKNIHTSNATVVMIDPSPLKIEAPTLQDEINNFADIKITLPDGTICWFGGNLGSDLTSSRSHKLGSQPSPPSGLAKTSLYLSRLESPTGNVIEFNYESKYFQRLVGISQTVKAKKLNGIFFGAQTDNDKNPVTTTATGYEPFISNIVWNNNRIDFVYNGNLLEKIEIKSNNSVLQDNRFEYYHVNANNGFQNPDCSHCGSGTVRKFLKKFIKKNTLNNNQDEVHEFIYNNLENLPPRFSYARDHWGYFNGKNNTYLVPNDVSKFNPSDYYSESASLFNYNEIQSAFNGVGADRNTDPLFAINGMLKKIIYPTKGETEILYEPNSYYGEVSIPGTQIYESLAISTAEDSDPPYSKSVITSPFPYDQIIQIAGSGYFNSYECEDELFIHESRYKANITVRREDNNSLVELFKLNPQNGTYISLGYGHEFHAGENGAVPAYFFAEEGRAYKVTLGASQFCTRTDAFFSYFSTASTIEHKNMPYGGMRVQSIVNRTENGIATKEDYFYGKKECLECSHAVFETLKPAISFFNSDNNTPTATNTAISSLGSSSLNGLYFSSSTPIAYPYVTKRLSSDNGNNGMIMRNYNIAFDGLPIISAGDWIPGTSYTNSFGNGNLLKEWIYESNNINPISEKEYHYTFNNDFDNSIEGFNLSISRQIAIYHSNNAPPQNISWFNVNKYFLRSKREYMDYMIQREFLPSGTVETRTDFIYNGNNKLLKSAETTSNSLNETLKTEYIYPQDGLHWQTDIMNQMVQKNMISTPVITKTSNNETGVSEQMTEYQIVNTNQILPHYIFTKKGGAAFEKNITYNSYDAQGNLTQYTLADGTPVSIIWGYNGQYPIAKVEGVAYTALTSYISTLQPASNGGTLTAGSFDALRNGMNTTGNNALVTCYIYKPLVGVTTIIQPNGQKETYEYDSSGRLMHVKDHNGNIIKKIDYHFKP